MHTVMWWLVIGLDSLVYKTL